MFEICNINRYEAYCLLKYAVERNDIVHPDWIIGMAHSENFFLSHVKFLMFLKI
jgi:hypothetical protein